MNKSEDRYVACSRLFLGTKRIECLPGSTLDEADVPDGKAGIKRMLDNGHIRVRSVDMTEIKTHVSSSPPVPKEIGEGDMTGTTRQGGGPSEADIEAARQQSPFALDPDGLTGIDLADLNKMISQRDPQIPAMDSKEKAIAFLSKDFVPAGQGQ